MNFNEFWNSASQLTPTGKQKKMVTALRLFADALSEMDAPDAAEIIDDLAERDLFMVVNDLEAEDCFGTEGMSL